MNVHKKYDKFKSNLYKHFIAVDDYIKRYSNIPAILRHHDDKTNKTIVFDNSIVSISYYIMYLSTEYAVYKKDNVSLDKTLRNLYLALKSLDRLDIIAEQILNKNHKSYNDNNGFMLSDDIEQDILSKYPHLKDSDGFNNIDNVKSDFLENKFVKLTDYVHLYLSLIIVYKVFLFDDKIDIEIGNRIETINIKNYISTIIDKHNNFLIKNKFKLKNSDDKLIAKKLVIITENILNVKYDNIKNRCFIDFLFKFKYYNLEIVDFVNNYLRNNYKNSILEYKILSIFTDFNMINIDKYHVLYNHLYDKYPQLSLIYNYLNNTVSKVGEKTILNILLNAPEIGPNNFADCHITHYDWSSFSILYAPEYKGDPNSKYKGYYNGIDYMLLYNLYILNYKK